MKKAFLLLSVLLSCSIFAQQNQLEPGTYVTKTKIGEDVKLVIDENNQFHITMLSGQLEQLNDSIYLRTKYESEPLFQVEFVTAATKPKIIKIDFGKNSYYSLYDIHLGVQKINDSSPEYKTVSDYLGIKEEAYEYTEDDDLNLSFEIEPVAFIYLANENYNGTTIEKYEVPNGVSEIKILKRNDLYGKLNLRGKYDTNTKEFTVSEGRKPIVFVKESTNETTNNFVRPLEAQQKKMWTYPGKEERYAAVDTAAVADYDYDYSGDKPPYVFKLKTEKSFNDALKVAQSSPDKILVVFYDTDKNAAKDFEKYIQKYESQIQDYMYDQYEPEMDKFNFFHATESDKNALKKMGVTDNKTIVFLNSDGTKIHHAKGSLRGYDYSYYNLSNYSSQLQLLNGKVKFDKAIADKKATPQQIQKALLAVVGVQEDYFDDDYAVALPPPTVELYEKGGYDYGAAVDSAAVEAVDDYELLPEKQNAYQFKSNQDAVALKYKQVLDFYQKEKTVNEELVKIITAELSDRGFTQKLFGTSNEVAKPIDFQSMDYLFQFYKEIEAIRTESYSMQTSQKVINSVCKMLGRPANENQKEKVNEYYDKLLKDTNYNSAVYRQRVNLYANSENKSELVNAFDLYFNSIVKPNTNLIEVLDANYQSEKARNWDSYKSDFASLANNTAWYIVENSKDKNEIQKAIQWSETSLKLEPNSNYYLDTLAQLYYKNGEKEKAILFEQKAIDSAKVSDETQVQTYQTVLEKMKNGTY